MTMVAMNSRIEERGRRDREQGKGRGGKKGEENEDEESCRTRSRKGGCGWHHWELFIPLYYTSALLFYEHFLPLRPRERRIQSYVFLRLRALKIYDRLIDTWKRGGERLVNFPTDRSQLPPRTISSSSSSSPKFIFPPTCIYLNSRDAAPGITGWLLIFRERRRHRRNFAGNANTVFNIKNEEARLTALGQ